jgi:hypothetical protein
LVFWLGEGEEGGFGSVWVRLGWVLGFVHTYTHTYAYICVERR